MNFFYYYKDRLSLPIMTDNPTPLTERMIRESVMAIIKLQLEEGETSPFKDAVWMNEKVHNWQKLLPTESNSPEAQYQLMEWIMTTEEMELAMEVMINREPIFDGQPNNLQVLVEEVDRDEDILSVYNLLNGIILVEPDLQ